MVDSRTRVQIAPRTVHVYDTFAYELDIVTPLGYTQRVFDVVKMCFTTSNPRRKHMSEQTNVVKLQPREQNNVPEFITAKNIEQMDDDELSALVSAIQTRRLASYHVYKQTKDQKEQLDRDKARDKIEKKCGQIIKDLNTIDKSLEKLETHIAELRGLRLQAGMELI